MIRDAHRLIWNFRNQFHKYWATPPILDALRFASIEAGEALDALLRQDPTYSRNHDKELSVIDELADTAIMLLTGLPDDFNKWAIPDKPFLGPLTLDRILFDVVETHQTYLTHRSLYTQHVEMTAIKIASWEGVDIVEDISRRLGAIHEKFVVLA